MYERFFNLRERPFSLTPDPDYLFPSSAHREALSYLRYAVEGHAGLVVITGEIGSGKTTILQTVMRGVDRQTSVARLVNTLLDGRELIEAVMLDYGLDTTLGQSKPMLLRDLAQFLVRQRTAGRLAILIIDEAQNLSTTALEEVRMLSNLETEKSKLIQIILVGQPNLRDVLARPELEQLRQRVTTSYHLRALVADETEAYINHRLKRAALAAPLVFGRDVTDLIHAAAQGVPRKINVIADAALLFGYGEECREIDADLVRQVLVELEATGVIGPPQDAATMSEAAARAPKVEIPVPAGVAPILASDVFGARERMLAERESQLAAREAQLREQHRLIMEGFDRLRDERVAPAALASSPSLRIATPPTGAQAPRAAAPAQAAHVRPTVAPARPGADAARPPLARTVARPAVSDSIWSRIRRGLFGAPVHSLGD
jgi:general secretion pathway protein A